MMVSNRTLLFQGSMFCFQGCNNSLSFQHLRLFSYMSDIHGTPLMLCIIVGDIPLIVTKATGKKKTAPNTKIKPEKNLPEIEFIIYKPSILGV